MKAGAAILIAAVLLIAGCGNPSPQQTPSATPVLHGEYPPPTWVQNEVAWQSLAAGDTHPGKCSWTLTLASHAAVLDGRNTSYLRNDKDPAESMAYVIVLRGKFRPPDFPGRTYTTMYLVIGDHPRGPYSRDYLALGFVSAQHKVSRLDAMHVYFPRMPVSAGVWGHTLAVGGPILGAFLLGNMPVAIYAGSKAIGQPFTTVRSNGSGFFALVLKPGVYTFKLLNKNNGYPAPQTITVKAGGPVAAGVYSQMM
jgi:hypothetical protein